MDPPDRVKTEAGLAKKLYDSLSGKVLTESGHNIRVYLDQVCLEDGEVSLPCDL